MLVLSVLGIIARAIGAILHQFPSFDAASSGMPFKRIHHCIQKYIKGQAEAVGF